MIKLKKKKGIADSFLRNVTREKGKKKKSRWEARKTKHYGAQAKSPGKIPPRQLKKRCFDRLSEAKTLQKPTRQRGPEGKSLFSLERR